MKEIINNSEIKFGHFNSGVILGAKHFIYLFIFFLLHPKNVNLCY